MSLTWLQVIAYITSYGPRKPESSGKARTSRFACPRQAGRLGNHNGLGASVFSGNRLQWCRHFVFALMQQFKFPDQRFQYRADP